MKSRFACAAALALAPLGAAAAQPAGSPPPVTSGPVDALTAAPGNFRLLLDNDQVRVLQYTLPPGARDKWHTHPPRVGHILSGGTIRVTQADGSHADHVEKAGDTYWGDFSPLHDTLNLGKTPYVALLVEVKGAAAGPAPAPASASADEAAIRAVRSAFNAAIAAGDLKAIAGALAENAQIVTGRNSLVFAGRAGQIGLWWEDLHAPSRGIYVRTPTAITLSPVGPMAMETGQWKGIDSKAASDWASGIYSAKWRKIDGAWKIETETYMTTACGGAYCR